MELSCDESVIREMGHEIKKDYSKSLLSLSTGGRIIGGSPLAFGGKNTKSRIKNILNYRKPKFWMSLIGIIIVVVVAIGLLSDPIEPSTSHFIDDTTNSEVESLVGYMVIEGNTVYFDEVEIVRHEDKKRVEELGLEDIDMPNMYTIINEKQEKNTFELADEVEYIFTDINLNFIEESEAEGDRIYITRKKDEFLKHLGEYNLNDIPLYEQRIPYFIEVKDGKVIRIKEKLEYTI